MNERAPEISVIIPVYNTERYLRECFDSVIGQTFDRIEILLMDDGSTDGSPAICDAYAEKDSRVRVYHRDNRGVSAARNEGIALASGRFICFADSDDYMAPQMLEKLYTLIQKHGAQIVCCGRFDAQTQPTRGRGKQPEERVISGKEAMRECVVSRMITAYPWDKLFEREVIQSLAFPPLRVGEDAVFVVQALRKAERVAITSEPLYAYRIREDSSSGGYHPKMLDLLTAWETVDAYVKRECPEYPEVMSDILGRRIWAHFVLADKMNSRGAPAEDPEYRRITEWLRRHRRDILACLFRPSSLFSWRRRLGAALFMLNEKGYRGMTRGRRTR